MKIAIVSRKLITGGVEKALINMLNELSEDKYDVTLYLMGRGGELEKDVPSYVKIRNIYWNESSFIQIIKNRIKKFKLKSAFNFCIYGFRSYLELKKGNYFKYEHFLSKMINRPDEIYDLVISYHASATFPVIYSIDYIKSRKSIL